MLLSECGLLGFPSTHKAMVDNHFLSLHSIQISCLSAFDLMHHNSIVKEMCDLCVIAIPKLVQQEKKLCFLDSVPICGKFESSFPRRFRIFEDSSRHYNMFVGP